MSKINRIALAQFNPTVGKLDSNVKQIISYISEAKKHGSDIVAFPELAVCGYPPADIAPEQGNGG